MTVPFAIPDSWSWGTIGDVVSRVEAGKSFTCLPRRARDDEWGIIKVSAMTWREFREHENKAVPPDREIDPRFEIHPGDILVSRANTEQYVGAPVLVGACRPRLLLSDKSLRLVPAPGIDKAWLLNVLASPFVRRQISMRASGQQDSMRNISQQTLLAIDLPIPPIEEQRRIVAVLEGCLSELEAALVQTLTIEKRVMSWETAVSIAIVQGRRPPSDRAGLENSAGWDEASIGDLALVGTGATPLRSRKEFYEGGTVPWVTSSLLNEPFVDRASAYITELALAETSVKVWPPGTLLVAMYGEGRTRGRCSELRISATTNQACAAVSLKPEWESYRSWVKLFFQASYEQNRRLASGGVQPNLNLGLIRNLRVPLPPAGERDRLMREFVVQADAAVRLRKAVKAASSRGANLRRSLLSEAFAGRLVPQDPSDEPASELMARIRAERAAAPKQKARSRRTQKELAAPPTRVTGNNYQQEALPL
ncbi:restriction endonuclease subunit S [Micromonospora sp. DT43]|uniref:restriction endonuclease subunit S n=1 Tax=Micromonospora sp. DT43 TaxID=3393440 RepID=UPI003CF988DE